MVQSKETETTDPDDVMACLSFLLMKRLEEPQVWKVFDEAVNTLLSIRSQVHDINETRIELLAGLTTFAVSVDSAILYLKMEHNEEFKQAVQNICNKLKHYEEFVRFSEEFKQAIQKQNLSDEEKRSYKK